MLPDNGGWGEIADNALKSIELTLGRLGKGEINNIYTDHGLCYYILDLCELALLYVDFWGAERPQ